MSKRRLSSEQKQENVSRKQFEEFLAEYEWVTTDVVPDLGEDILVRIFENGVATGISFYVQIKSTHDLEEHRLKSGDMAYSVEVKDLEHWDGQVLPVLLVLWDINRREGIYSWIKSQIAQLDSKGKPWRQQKTVKVHFPHDHILNEMALRKLRRELGIQFHDVVAVGKSLNISVGLRFPNTDEGATKMAEFERFVKAGDPVEIEGKYIEKFEFPDWWSRLHGQMEMGVVHMGPAEHDEINRFQLRFFSANSEAVVLPHVEMRMEKGGQEVVTFSNTHQKAFFNVRSVVNKLTENLELLIRLDFANLTGYEARQAIRIQNMLNQGCQVVFRNLDIQQEFSLPIASNTGEKIATNAVTFIDNVCRVQDATGMVFCLGEQGTFTNRDEEAAEKLVTILDTGRYSSLSNLTFSLQRPAVEMCYGVLEKALPLNLRAEADSVAIPLLDGSVDLGSAMIYVEGYWDSSPEEVSSWLETAAADDTYEVSIPNADVTEVFERWASDYPNKDSFA